MVIGRREKKRKRSKENDSHEFYCFKKRWMMLLNEIGISRGLRITISIPTLPRYVHICTRQVLGTEMTVNVFWEKKGLLDRLSLSISVIVQIKRRRRRRRKKNRMDR